MPESFHRVHWILLFLLSFTATGYAQDLRQDCACVLHVAGPEGRESAITAETWATLPRASVEVVDHRGGNQVYRRRAVPRHQPTEEYRASREK
jgi:hypothetical protein